METEESREMKKKKKIVCKIRFACHEENISRLL